MTALLAGLCVLSGAVLLGLAWRAMGSGPVGQRRARIEASPQFHGGRFENPLPEHMGGGWSMLKRFLAKAPHGTPLSPPPVHARRATDFPALQGALAVTWLGHSSLLIELDGTRVLTDPVFSQRASPLSFAGPTRFHPVPIAVAELPEVEAVVLSHDHYDHLDMDTIIALNSRVDRFVVPLGLGAHLEYWGVPTAHITELDWWQEVELGSLRLVCAPARHFSGRGISDRNRTLWASWAMIGPAHRMYFSGDTAMFPGFAEIGRRLGPFDVAALEVGAYDRAWPDVHLGPEQAVAAHKALRAHLMLPVHWGTFDLALHAWTEPVVRTRAAAAAVGVRLLTPEVGQRIDAATPPASTAWWPDVPCQTASEHPVVSTGI
ncbi:MAG: MBL fold metallo-hydrolase [Myxococcales bacterium]|nr:MBL fold metallo-hydrolase [Myxococcales bacterium]